MLIVCHYLRGDSSASHQLVAGDLKMIRIWLVLLFLMDLVNHLVRHQFVWSQYVGFYWDQ